MKINEVITVKQYHVVLENGVDFGPIDLCFHGFFQGMIIKEEKLEEIAKKNGFDACVRCKRMANSGQQFVNAYFIREEE